jgi:hypothetical protein
MRKLVPYIESHPLTRGKVNFTQQSYNQEYALEASVSRLYATLDLKDASDRVSVALFDAIFPDHIKRAFHSCRSVATVLPNGELLPLRKMAPMGSALCFPILALTIWALTEATLRHKHRSKRGDFLVYGDDLIVPTASVADVVDSLERAHLKVNLEKCFINSHFRESCGMDAFMGVRVTPIRLKRTVNEGHPRHSLYAHLLSVSESFFNKGYWLTCAFLRKHIRSVFGNVPWTVKPEGLGYYCPDPQICESRNAVAGFRRRWNPNYQCSEYRIPQVVGTRSRSKLPGYPSQLLKGLLGLYSRSAETNEVTLRGRCVLRNVWRSVYSALDYEESLCASLQFLSAPYVDPESSNERKSVLDFGPPDMAHTVS